MKRYLFALVFGALCAACRAEEPPPVAELPPAVLEEATVPVPTPACPCGCSGDTCSCKDCPTDRTRYGAARKAAVEQRIALVVWVGFEDAKAEKEVKALHLHVGSFEGDRRKRVVASYFQDGELYYTDDSVYQPGVSAAQLRAATRAPMRAAPVRPPAQPSYRTNTIIGGSAGIRAGSC